MNRASVFATPQVVTDLGDCLFYHTTDLPGQRTIAGPWDLRPGIAKYLGGVSFRGKRILDVGAASGFLSFHMEREGGEVVSYDLSEAHAWDHVPYAGTDLPGIVSNARARIRKLNNSYWYCHRAHGSKNRVVHGTAYTIPADIGPFDIGVFGSILEHLRDPFLALQTGLALVTDTAIIAETIPRRQFWHRWVPWRMAPEMRFLPDAKTQTHDATWWVLPPQLVQQFLGVLGFEQTRMTYHTQLFEGSRRLLYTIVGKRTKPAAQMQMASRAA
jgi:2-polyprenyl-3-methyl-5-hydroxy-6-metoxy-1,4-benzoquinol methylase